MFVVKLRLPENLSTARKFVCIFVVVVFGLVVLALDSDR